MTATRLAAFAAATIALLLTFPAPTTAETPPGAAQVRHLTSGGIVRTYRVFRPSSAGAHPALVMMLHGGFGTGQGAEGADGWDALASARGFIVVYPDGIARAWNAGRCCGQPYARKIDDVAFLTAVIGEVERQDGADPHRVFVTDLTGARPAFRANSSISSRSTIRPVASCAVPVKQIRAPGARVAAMS